MVEIAEIPQIIKQKAKRNMQLEKKTLFLLTKNSKILRMRLC